MPIGTPHGTLDYKQVSKVTFVGASSNTVIDTTTGSLGVGVDGNGPTSNLHVVGNTRLEGDINMLHTANTASIKLNSNVVTEFPRSKKLIKYPRVNLTSASYNAYESGYKVTVSGFVNSSNYPWKAFNGIDYEVGMLLSGLNYDTNGNANTSGTTASRLSASDSTPYGEWLKLELPNKIKLDRYVFTSRNHATHWAQGPEAGQVWGKNDDSNWTHLHTFTNSGFTGESQTASFDVQTDNYYKYYAFIVTKTFAAGSDYYICLPELKYFGVPEYDPDAHGTDVTLKSLTNVPNTDWLEVYYDAKNFVSGSVTVQDETTNNRDAAMNATFDNGEIKAFSFSGAYTSNVTTSDHGLGTGDVTYTISYWFKRTAVAGNYDYVVMLGNGGVSYSSILMWINNNYLSLDHWSAALRVPELIELNKWYHVAAGHRGGDTPSLENDFIYIDGKKVTPLITQTAAPFTLAGSKLTLGSEHNGTSEFLNGKIANFRLFNRALSQDEIYQLYAYQKEDFGHGTNSLTLKAGRLGIGTSEPRAMLDVRGDFYAPGSVVQIQTNVFTADASTSDTTWKDISSNFGVTITPKFANSNFLIQAMIHQGGDNSGDARFTFYRIGRYVNDTLTEVGNGDTGNTSGIGTVCTAAHNWGAGGASAAQTYDLAIANVNIVYVDQPNTTSPITYRIRWNSNPGGGVGQARTAYINRVDNHNDGYRPNTISTLVITEIAQ